MSNNSFDPHDKDLDKRDRHAKTVDGAGISGISKSDGAVVTTLLSGQGKDFEPAYFYDYSWWYRWLLLVFYFVLAVVMGPAFFNWPPLEGVFKNSGAYSTLCPDGVVTCVDRNEAISAMLVVAIATMFSLDIVAGILLDCFGGKVCCLFGVACQLIGWLLTAFSSPSFNGYLPGLVFLAAGCDPGFFGLLSVANLFPGWESTIVAILGAARSVSYFNYMIIAVMMDSAGLSLMAVSLGAFCLVAVLAVMAVFLVPYQSFPKVIGATHLPTEDGENKVAYSELLGKKPAFDLQSLSATLGSQFRIVVKHALTLHFALFCITPLLSLIRNNYYSVSYKEHLPNTIAAYTYLNPLSFIPCPLVGMFADGVSTALTILVLAVCAAGSMAAVMIPGVAFEYISLVLNYIFISFCVSEFYCYVGAVYPQNAMGKLVGISLLIGGLGSMSATPMYNFAKRTENFLLMDLVVVAMEVAVIAICIFLYLKIERPIQKKKAAVLLEGKASAEPGEEELTETTV